MITTLLVFIGLIPMLYVVFSVWPAIIIHCLEDTRCPKDTKDFIRMTYLPYIFNCKKRKIPY